MTVDCLACGLSVPDHRAAPIQTPAGTFDLCLGCHPNPPEGRNGSHAGTEDDR